MYAEKTLNKKKKASTIISKTVPGSVVGENYEQWMLETKICMCGYHSSVLQGSNKLGGPSISAVKFLPVLRQG